MGKGWGGGGGGVGGGGGWGVESNADVRVNYDRLESAQYRTADAD